MRWFLLVYTVSVFLSFIVGRSYGVMTGQELSRRDFFDTYCGRYVHCNDYIN